MRADCRRAQVVEITPQLAELDYLLSKRPYGLQDEDDATAMDEDGRAASEGLYSFDELLDMLQVNIASVACPPLHRGRSVSRLLFASEVREALLSSPPPPPPSSRPARQR